MLLFATTLFLSQSNINEFNFSNLEKNPQEIKTNRVQKEKYKQKIITYLEGKEHSYRDSIKSMVPKYNEDFLPQADSLHEDQLKVINLMLKNLKNKKFIEEIGGAIFNDVDDEYSAHGGVIESDLNEKLKLTFVENKLPKIKRFNDLYLPSEEINSMDYLAEFHFHAETYNQTPLSGPNPLDQILQKSKLYKKEFVHEFVITSLEKGKFNIDYFGSHKGTDGKMRVVDLGNYNYDFPSK